MNYDELKDKIQKGMTREQIVTILGQPDAMGITSRKYTTPSIYVYGDTKLWFESWKNGKLYSFWDWQNHKYFDETEEQKQIRFLVGTKYKEGE